MRRARRYTELGIVVVIVLLGLWGLVSPQGLVERDYSRLFYPRVTHLVVPLTSPLPFSLSALLLALLPFAGTILLFTSWRRRKGGFGAWFRGRAWRGFVIAALLYGWFLVAWGANYGREPVEVLLNLPQTGSVEAGEAEALARFFGEVVRENVGSDRDVTLALVSVRASLVRLLEGYDLTGLNLPAGVKSLPAGTLLTFGYAGVASPFTLEAHIDGGLTDVSKVAVGAHELAHTAGLAREADADLIAALAGLGADDTYARYAVALSFFAKTSRGLPEETYETLYDMLPEAAKQDLLEMRETYTRYYRRALARPLSSLYDRYLRTQGVEAGVGDYDRVVTLLISAQRRGLLEG